MPATLTKSKNTTVYYRDLHTDNIALGMWSTRDLAPSLMKELGPSEFTEQMQAQNPETQMTRLVKDCIRVGNWCHDFDENGQPLFWDCKLSELQSIVHNYLVQTERGIKHNLCWGHGDPETGIVDDRDTIAKLENVVLLGDTLWIAAYVNPEQARELQSQQREVSVRVVDDWVDGQGRIYPGQSLLHAAVVDHPVMDSQGPFRQLSMKGKKMPTTFKKRTVRQLANDGGNPDQPPADDGGTDDGGVLQDAIAASPEGTTVVPLKETVQIINRILPDGVDLPEGTTEENFNGNLKSVVDIATGMGLVPSQQEKEQADAERAGVSATAGGKPIENPEVLVADDPMASFPAEFANTAAGKALSAVLKKLTDDNAAMRKELSNIHATDKRTMFEETLDELAAAGKIDAAERKHLVEMGQRHQWDKRDLAMYQQRPSGSGAARPRGSQSRQLATSTPPPVKGTSGGRRDRAEVERLAGMIPGCTAGKKK